MYLDGANDSQCPVGSHPLTFQPTSYKHPPGIHNLLHAARVAVAAKTGDGWSLNRVRERVLKVASQVIRHARRIVFRISSTKAALWAAIGDFVCHGAPVTTEVAR